MYKVHFQLDGILGRGFAVALILEKPENFVSIVMRKLILGDVHEANPVSLSVFIRIKNSSIWSLYILLEKVKNVVKVQKVSSSSRYN